MKLSQWAKSKGIHYNTALKWFKLGKIPNARQLESGTILIDELPDLSKKYDSEEELKKDMMIIVEQFCFKLYGLEKGKEKTEEIRIIIK